MNSFPALILCGPPHSGKSTLVCALSAELRSRRVAHYVLRAAPDGEGDWACEAPLDVAARIRKKHAWSENWVRAVCDDIARRHLPLIVDMGGRPTLSQEVIFDQCGHAIVLTRDEAQRIEWRERAARHSLHVLADLRSDLSADGAAVRVENGTLTGAYSANRTQPELIRALADTVADTFGFSEDDLRRVHLDQNLYPWISSVNVVDFDLWLHRLHPTEPKPRFRATDIPVVLSSLVPYAGLALYGRLWAQLVVALASRHDVRWIFSTSAGWVAPAQVKLVEREHSSSGDVNLTLHHRDEKAYSLQVALLQPYLSYERNRRIHAPKPKGPVGDWSLEISGKLPMWLLAGLARAYAGFKHITVFEPRA